ncbi:MAG: enoyl-CoA hydratase/isomerase family protein [Deltaproteobacteria bacterium]|nr:enoyl-CoA hydratase/isomerase family protein [Deltaproteobacteria bacterium]
MNTEEKTAAQFVRMEKQGFIATLVLDRPERKNSLNIGMLIRIAEYLEELSATDDIRTVIIRGEGGESFSSGYTISEIPKDITDEYFEALKGKNPLDIGLSAIERYPYPVIAMIDGYALGAGCELAMTCDIRVASEGSRMGIPPSRLGVIYHPAGVQKFINIMGLANAQEALYTGRFYGMERAKEMGMVNYVVPKDELQAFTYKLAEEIAGNAPLSLKGHKEIFRRILHYQGLRQEDYPEIEKLIADALKSEDFKDGASAFFQKRRPLFKGR